MAETIDQIIARLRTEEPVRYAYDPTSEDGRRPYTEEEYEASILESAGTILAQQQQSDAEAARKALRRQFVLGMGALRTDYAKLDDETQAVSQLEFRRMLKRVNRGVTWLGEVLQDLSLVERD